MFSLSGLITFTTLISTIIAAPTSPKNKAVGSNTVPLNGLPSPSGLTLKYIGLGIGTQNYTCPNTTVSPIAVGAVASLYDATYLSQAKSKASIPTLPALAFSTGSSMGLPTLGHHYFTVSGTPTFHLEAAQPAPLVLSAKKVASVPAPALSVPNSVDWLYLTDDGKGISEGLKAVYRVETAGGKAPSTCSKVGDIQVKYAAEYWFYA